MKLILFLLLYWIYAFVIAIVWWFYELFFFNEINSNSTDTVITILLAGFLSVATFKFYKIN